MNYDIAIIGAGPGGYVGAIRAAQLGASVALIERKELGGTCLNKGCIPTKAMLASVHCLHNLKQASNFGIELKGFEVDLDKIYSRQKKIVQQMSKGLAQLLKTYPEITIYSGEASILAPDRLSIEADERIEIEAKNVIIATGSACSSLGNIEVDHEAIINSDDALNMMEYPEKMVIIGGGAIGIEWARIYSALGVDVTLVEMMEQIAPACDKDIANVALKLFKRNKVKVMTGVGVNSIEKTSEGLLLHLNNDQELLTDKVMLAVGRKPVLDLKGLSELNIELNGRYIKVDEKMRTNISGVYAIGDVVGKLPLAHVASHEAIVAVETILNKEVHPVDYASVPFVIYGQPELAGVGMTEEQAQQAGMDYEANIFYYAANGKAVAESEKDGIIKSIVDIKTGKIMGVHAAGVSASDIIHQGVIAVNKGMTVDDFREIVFAHPTLSESFYESILKLHVPNKSNMIKSKR